MVAFLYYNFLQKNEKDKVQGIIDSKSYDYIKTYLEYGREKYRTYPQRGALL
jgi:hypothetical protein